MEIQELKARLKYDSVTGDFTWLSSKVGRFGGTTAGSIRFDGYITIKIAGKAFRAHRLAWLFVHGEMPDGILDHINGDRTDNRISNLRIVTASQNRINSATRGDCKSGAKGVCWTKREGKWHVQIHVDGKKKFLGYFSDFSSAKAAYADASKRYHGEFARTG